MANDGILERMLCAAESVGCEQLIDLKDGVGEAGAEPFQDWVLIKPMDLSKRATGSFECLTPENKVRLTANS